MAWCPGCGHYTIRNIMLEVFNELALNPENLVLVSGIGQAAKAPQYYDVNFFNGLHGRALPAATGIKAANPDLTVIVESGDGDMYGEGGNHFIHAVRRNPDMTLVVHNNMVYGLTKGQASPTTLIGMKTPIQVNGVFETPINPLALAISLDASFVARTSAHRQDLTKQLIKQAVNHKGFALVDVFSSCVTFNKLNTWQWFKHNTEEIPKSHDPENREAAFAMALRQDPWMLGVFYKNSVKLPFEMHQKLYEKQNTPLFMRQTDRGVLAKLVQRYKVA